MRNKNTYETRVYNNEKSMQKGNNRMAELGYQVDHVTTDSRTGCMRRIMGGFIFARPKVFHTVTYQLIPPEVKEGE
jgi:hypothetical protein